MWALPHLIRKSAKEALSDWVTAEKKNYRQQDKLATYRQVVNYLLETYVTDDVIADAEAEITKFKKPVENFAIQYSQALW